MWRYLSGAAAMGVMVFLGCGDSGAQRAAAPKEIPIEDVSQPVDAAIDVEADPKAIARNLESVGGVLPSDFPAHFTLPRPASIIDLSDEGEWATVVLRTSSTPGQVASFFAQELPRGGWREEGGIWRREARQVRVSVRSLPEGARVQLDYR